MFKIKAERVIIRGEQCYRILEIRAQEKEVLKIMEEQKTYFYKKSDNLWYRNGVDDDLTSVKEGAIYSKGSLKAAIKTLKRIALKTKAAEAKLAEENLFWCGEKVWEVE